MRGDALWVLVRRFTRGFVLAFHDIDALSFEHLIDALHPIRPIPLADLVARRRSGRPTAGLCAITVDDGVAQTTHALASVCRRRNWPVTFFLPVANINTGAGYAFEWWRRLRPFVSGRKWYLSGGVLDLERAAAAQELDATMERLWHTAPPDMYFPFTMELVRAVVDELGIPLDSLRPARALTWDEVTQLSQDDRLSFESHGVSHVAFSALAQDELVRELRESRDAILEHTGRTCTHFCYPFGSARSIGTLAPLLASRYYESAVTMSLGPVDGGELCLMPRIPLYAENSPAFARAKVTIKCSRLGSSPAYSQPAPGAKVGAAASS
jgi:peptidoglycan/xylan/chitin deacetylase (PgdA/CDA1 family)